MDFFTVSSQSSFGKRERKREDGDGTGRVGLNENLLLAKHTPKFGAEAYKYRAIRWKALIITLILN